MVQLVFIGAFVGLLALAWWAIAASLWSRYPKSTGTIAVLAVASIIFAALTFSKFFPSCHVNLKGRCSYQEIKVR